MLLQCSSCHEFRGISKQAKLLCHMNEAFGAKGLASTSQACNCFLHACRAALIIGLGGAEAPGPEQGGPRDWLGSVLTELFLITLFVFVCLIWEATFSS